MESNVLIAKYGSDKTPLKLGNIEIPCYVLNNGLRVFSGRGLQKAIGYESDSGQWMRSFCKIDGLSMLFCAGENSILSQLSNPVKFKRPNASGSQSTTNGYDVTLLVDICSAIIDANRAGNFDNDVMVHNADVIIRSVAKVGIIALVDEATGYQYDRERDELQKILKAYVSEELLPWQKRFPDIYYKELFRLNGWDFTVKGIRNRPSVIGKWTNTLIYEQLPKGVLAELKKKTPKSRNGNNTARFHQSLTLDVGEPSLTAQITTIVAIFQVSDNMKEMWSNFARLVERKAGQLTLPFVFDDNGHTIVPQEETKENILQFNSTQKSTLECNLKEDY